MMMDGRRSLRLNVGVEFEPRCVGWRLVFPTGGRKYAHSHVCIKLAQKHNLVGTVTTSHTSSETVTISVSKRKFIR
jgi:hypothetical protein